MPTDLRLQSVTGESPPSPIDANQRYAPPLAALLRDRRQSREVGSARALVCVCGCVSTARVDRLPTRSDPRSSRPSLAVLSWPHNAYPGKHRRGQLRPTPFVVVHNARPPHRVVAAVAGCATLELSPCPQRNQQTSPATAMWSSASCRHIARDCTCKVCVLLRSRVRRCKLCVSSMNPGRPCVELPWPVVCSSHPFIGLRLTMF